MMIASPSGAFFSLGILIAAFKSVMLFIERKNKQRAERQEQEKQEENEKNKENKKNEEDKESKEKEEGGK
jgi:sortase (surface protein transpeptidase)